MYFLTHSLSVTLLPFLRALFCRLLGCLFSLGRFLLLDWSFCLDTPGPRRRRLCAFLARDADGDVAVVATLTIGAAHRSGAHAATVLGHALTNKALLDP